MLDTVGNQAVKEYETSRVDAPFFYSLRKLHTSWRLAPVCSHKAWCQMVNEIPFIFQWVTQLIFAYLGICFPLRRSYRWAMQTISTLIICMFLMGLWADYVIPPYRGKEALVEKFKNSCESQFPHLPLCISRWFCCPVPSSRRDGRAGILETKDFLFLRASSRPTRTIPSTYTFATKRTIFSKPWRLVRPWIAVCCAGRSSVYSTRP